VDNSVTIRNPHTGVILRLAHGGAVGEAEKLDEATIEGILGAL